MTWVREGECCRCGECCASGDPFNGTRGVGEVAGACPLLRFEDTTAVCTGYGVEHYYLIGCALWPSHPDQIRDYPSCTYTFTEV